MSVRMRLDVSLPSFLRPYLDRLAASPLGYRLAQGVFWSVMGAVISRGLALAASVLVARTMGKEAYGEFGMIRSTIGMFGTLAGFGLGTTATKYVAEFRSKDSARAGRTIALAEVVALGTSSVLAAVLAVLSPWLAAHIMAAPHLAGMLRISALLLLFSAMSGAETGALAGFEAFRAIAIRNFWSGLANFPLMIVGVYLWGLAGAVWALVASTGITWVLNFAAVRKESRRQNVPCQLLGWRSELSVLWQFSMPAAFSSAMVGPVTWACNAMLVNTPNGYAEMGVFSAADQWRSAMLFLPGTLSQIALPILTNLWGRRDGRYARVLALNIAASGVAAALVALPISVLARPIMSAYGEQFATGSAVLVYLSLTAILIAVNGVIGAAIASKGRMWVGVMFNVLWALALLSFTKWFLMAGLGASALGIALLLSYALHTIWQGGYVLIAFGHGASAAVRKDDVASPSSSGVREHTALDG